MSALGYTLYWVLTLFTLVLVARAVLGYIPLFKPNWRPTGAMAVLTDGVYRLTDPVLRPLERLIPPLRIGTSQISIAFTVLFIIVYLLRQATFSL